MYTVPHDLVNIVHSILAVLFIYKHIFFFFPSHLYIYFFQLMYISFLLIIFLGNTPDGDANS